MYRHDHCRDLVGLCFSKVTRTQSVAQVAFFSTPIVIRYGSMFEVLLVCKVCSSSCVNATMAYKQKLWFVKNIYRNLRIPVPPIVLSPPLPFNVHGPLTFYL